MSRIVLGVILGLLVGLISIGIMLPRNPVLTGVNVGLLVSVPDAIVTKAYLPVIVGGIVFGLLAAWAVKELAA